MAQEPAEQATSFPLAAYNFRVSVGSIEMRFAKVSGLSREYRTLVYRDGLSFCEGERIARYFVDGWTSLTLEQGAVAGSRELAQWLESGEPRPIAVSLCDAEGLPALIWRVARALPVRLAAPALDAAGNEAVIDTLELRAAGIAVSAP